MSCLTREEQSLVDALTDHAKVAQQPALRNALRQARDLIKQLALRAMPAGEGVVVPRDWVLDEEGHLAERINEMGDTRKVSADEAYAEVCRGLLASPAPVTADPSGNPLLWNVHCMYQQADRDMGWHGQWRDLLAAIEQHLQRVGYPNAAPANESYVDKGTAE